MLNLHSIYASNLVGLLLMAMLLASKGWCIQTRNHESQVIRIIIYVVIIGCIVDPFASYLDGKPGSTALILLYIFNTVLYFLTAVIGPAYVTIVVCHIHDRAPLKLRYFLYFLFIWEIVLLIINLFYPIVFGFDESNHYYRLGFYWFFFYSEILLVAYAIWVYLDARLHGAFVRFFPTWQFLAPIGVGMVVQSCMYGVSLIWPCVGVGTCCMTICLQNECIYLDKLTGVFNRFYLNEVLDNARKHGVKIKAMMLDMNGFKFINDNYSHTEGDNALIAMADILNNVIKNNGVVIRFAGDEFVILLDAEAQYSIDEYKDAILCAIHEYNYNSGKPYELSAAIGGETIDLCDTDTADFINAIDRHMYESKERYYREHDRRGR